MYLDQSDFDVRCEWGLEGVTRLAPISDVVVIVDVLSFSTSVDIATGNGAEVYPYRHRDDAAAYAESLGAVPASTHRTARASYSLSPASLLHIPAGTRLVLPSPNGSTLTLSTGEATTFAGCLRNAGAVARAAQNAGRRIAVIAAGERWPDGTLRPAFEDLVGAGAIISRLAGRRSPEARAAEAVFAQFAGELLSCIEQCISGKELIERGFAEDVRLAASLDASSTVPMLVKGAYKAQAAP